MKITSAHAGQLAVTSIAWCCMVEVFAASDQVPVEPKEAAYCLGTVVYDINALEGLEGIPGMADKRLKAMGLRLSLLEYLSRFRALSEPTLVQAFRDGWTEIEAVDKAWENCIKSCVRLAQADFASCESGCTNTPARARVSRCNDIYKRMFGRELERIAHPPGR